MGRKPVLLDRFGRPVLRSELTREVAAATLTGVRSPLPGYPADGLTPARLAGILREADAGNPLSYLELAEAIEERDLHYLGVLRTRRLSVAQLDITVEAASDDSADVERADQVRDWLDRGELADELFDILDAVGKGYSLVEIIWDFSAGQVRPARLEWRDPRWFRFDRRDLTTVRMLGDDGQELPLPAMKFVQAVIRAKSGLPVRGGLARPGAWAWMFKAYSQRDWAIFTQTYGQPLRLGRYGPGATEEDKDTLFRAVANIAGDCAAIIPEAMAIEFVQPANSQGTSDLYRARCDWLDQQISKAVLGQTGTTDAIAGGFAGNRIHREVQEDIERADARALASALNRDLIVPWMQLEYGPLPRYPVLRIGRPEVQDLGALSGALAPMIDRGLRVSQASIRDIFGLEEPADGADMMRPARQESPAAALAPATSSVKRFSGPVKRQAPFPGGEVALNAEGPSAGRSDASAAVDLLSDRLGADAAPAMEEMLAGIEAMVAAAGSMEELREMLLTAWPRVDSTRLAKVLALGLVAAHAGGRAMVEDEAGDA